MAKRRKPLPLPEVKPNCKICKNTDGSYENYLIHCKILNVKRPYGSRECSYFNHK